MKHLSANQKALIFYMGFLGLIAFTALAQTLFSPSEPGNSFLLGYSISRLILASGLLIAFLLSASLALKVVKNKTWADEFLDRWFGGDGFSWVTVCLGSISFGLGWIGLFISPSQAGKLEGYLGRLQPVLLSILLAGFATLILSYVRRRKSPTKDQVGADIFRRCIIYFLACIPFLALMLFSKFGIDAKEDFWYGAGVPILTSQLIGVIVGGMIFFQVEQKWKFKRFDLVVFILIFFATAFLWAIEPLQKGFSFVGPYQPNDVFYPLFDPGIFDAASQFPLIGQKLFIFNGNFFERPLYLSFLVYLHTLFGQNYETLMAAQAGIFAVFPALIYLIGRSLNMRVVGFTAALAAMFRGINSIAASNMIDLANPKMILTDFPTAIGIALIVLLTCEWLKSPHTKQHYALGLGGALGLALMLRTNALILLALIPVYALLKFIPHWRNWLTHSLLIMLGVIAITLPWELRNRSLGGQMYSAIILKFQGVIDQRYSAPVSTGITSFTLQNTRIISSLAQSNPDILAQNTPACNSIICFVPNHFLHNMVTSVLIFPTSPVLDSLRHTVIDNNPYWNQHWDGTFSLSSLFSIVVNLFFILLGISYAWKKHHLPGISPLAIFIFYNLSNAFARTSGGRYVTLIDWILTIYFLLGFFHIITQLVNSMGTQWNIEGTTTDKIAHPTLHTSKTIIALIALLGFGSLIPLSERLHPERYQNFDINAALTQYEQALETAGLGNDSIESFLQEEKADVLVGRALYPRHYQKDLGEFIYYYPTVKLPFPRTTFTLIGSSFNYGVILPGAVPQHFPHASDVIVIGCRENEYFDALAVIILDEEGAVYTRSPQSALTCPLQQPVCSSNSDCQ